MILVLKLCLICTQEKAEILTKVFRLHLSIAPPRYGDVVNTHATFPDLKYK